MAYQRKTWINRFPICAMVYKEAAEMIGYDKDEAKSLGLARAIFFAAAKSGRGVAGGKKYYQKKDIEGQAKNQYRALKGYDVDSVEILNFAGIGTYVIHTDDGSVRGFIGGKPILPKDYDRSVKEKIILAGKEAGYITLKLFILRKLSELSPAELNSTAIYKLYESIRDKVRKVEFLERAGEINVRLPTKANVNIA